MNSTNRTELSRRRIAARSPDAVVGDPAVSGAAGHPPRSQNGTPAPSVAPGRTVLSFHIQRLTLEGISRADAGRVTAAMRRKIAELAGTTAALSRASAAEHRAVRRGIGAAGSSPEEIGQHIATQIFKGLGLPRILRGNRNAEYLTATTAGCDHLARSDARCAPRHDLASSTTRTRSRARSSHSPSATSRTARRSSV